MGKIRNFCKLHRAEIMYTLVAVMYTTLAVYGSMCWSGDAVGGIIISTAVVQAILGYYIQKLEQPGSPPSHSFIRAWYAGFTLQASSLSVGVMITQPETELFRCLLMIISFEAFVATFGYMIIVNRQPNDNNHQQSKNMKKFI